MGTSSYPSSPFATSPFLYTSAAPAEVPAAPRGDDPPSRESKCYIVADMYRAAWPNNKACVDCVARLTREQRRRFVEAPSGQACIICDLKSTKPENFTKPFVDFLTENPTIFHAVEHFKGKLSAVGFTEVSWLAMGGWKETARHRGLTCSSVAPSPRRLVRQDQTGWQVLRHA